MHLSFRNRDLPGEGRMFPERRRTTKTRRTQRQPIPDEADYLTRRICYALFHAYFETEGRGFLMPSCLCVWMV